MSAVFSNNHRRLISRKIAVLSMLCFYFHADTQDDDINQLQMMLLFMLGIRREDEENKPGRVHVAPLSTGGGQGSSSLFAAAKKTDKTKPKTQQRPFWNIFDPKQDDQPHSPFFDEPRRPCDCVCDRDHDDIHLIYDNDSAPIFIDDGDHYIDSDGHIVHVLNPILARSGGHGRQKKMREHHRVRNIKKRSLSVPNKEQVATTSTSSSPGNKSNTSMFSSLLSIMSWRSSPEDKNNSTEDDDKINDVEKYEGVDKEENKEHVVSSTSRSPVLKKNKNTRKGRTSKKHKNVAHRHHRHLGTKKDNKKQKILRTRRGPPHQRNKVASEEKWDAETGFETSLEVSTEEGVKQVGRMGVAATYGGGGTINYRASFVAVSYSRAGDIIESCVQNFSVALQNRIRAEQQENGRASAAFFERFLALGASENAEAQMDADIMGLGALGASDAAVFEETVQMLMNEARMEMDITGNLQVTGKSRRRKAIAYAWVEVINVAVKTWKMNEDGERFQTGTIQRFDIIDSQNPDAVYGGDSNGDDRRIVSKNTPSRNVISA